MSLLLNEEQRILKNGAHEFFGARLPVSDLRRLRDSDDVDGFDRNAWREMAEMGWAGILIPETWGGLDFGYKGLGQILEEAGRTLAASPLVATALTAAPLLVAGGSAAYKDRILPAVARGECLLALAVDELSRHRPTAVRTRATRRGSNYVLNGRKTFVLDGHVADHLLVLARSDGADDDAAGLSLFVVDRGADGVSLTRHRMVDSRNASGLVLHEVTVTADAVLGEPGDAYRLLEPILDGARAGLAAEMLGSGLEAFERTLAYLKMRQQFGVAIGSFQALKHRAALMFCEIELARSAVLAALDGLESAAADSRQLCSLAKAKACDMLDLVTCEAVQMHGGIGMTDDEDIGLFLKRARVAQQIFGDASFHRDRFATLSGF